VGVPGEGVDDQYGVLTRPVQLAPSLVGERNLGQMAAELRLEGAYSVVEFAEGALGRGVPSPGPWV
jgi:hypothetical protein